MPLVHILPLDGTSILFIILNCIILIYILNHKKTNKNFPPGPRPLPLVGNVFILDRSRPFKTLMELKEKYGSVFSIQLGFQKMVVLSGYETVKEALVLKADQFSERPDIPIFKQITKGNGQPFLATIPMNAATSNIIVSLIMGKRLEYDDENFIKLLVLNSESFKLVGGPYIQLYNMFPMLHPLPGPHYKVLEHQNILKDFFRKIFIQHREVLCENDKRSYIDAFMSKMEEEKNNPYSHFHEMNLLCSVTNLFVAGTETTSSTLFWGLLILIKHPNIQMKVHEEIDRVIGESQPRAHHRQMMPFTDAVIHEIQRFADILPMDLPHETTSDVILQGYCIPKGTYIIPLLRSVHRDKNHWEKPDHFHPQHFLDEQGKFVKREAFMPFSAGRRLCLGETLARMELFLFFTSLVQNFCFHAPEGVNGEDIDLSPIGGLTVCPPNIQVRALARSRNA
ncbi:hypothetical protein SKAU_G00197210 [Synaphobranchus kaupii]|uniref:Cytochrome P450 n=1 Tax=Synaphobranchus kaupii TaxID=118154 RepID=A0A9Q1FEY2_SYNKA|nr:hypothetical protein SKAU_G00197210 [Synaphobranchus kaupii]